MTFNKLKKRVTNDQCTILSAIWQYYLEKNQWIPSRILHYRFNRSKVLSNLERLGGSVAFETGETGKERYQLTFLGVLLTDQGEKAEQLLARYLEYVREQFVSNQEIEKMKSQEVEAALGLTTQESQSLNQLIFLSSCYGGSASSGGQEWSVEVPYDVEDFPSITDFRVYIQTRAFKDFDQSVPVDKKERISYLQRRNHEERPRELLEPLSRLERAVRQAFSEPPQDEIRDLHPVVRVALTSLNIPFTTEQERVTYATTSAIPDFVLWEGKCVLEVKLLKDRKDLTRITSEINDDILKYGDRFPKKVFLVYDCGTLRDIMTFRKAFMGCDGVFVLVIKH